MTVGLRLAAFGAVLVVLAGGGAALGAAVGPIDTGGAEAHADQDTELVPEVGDTTEPPGGLAIAEDGYRFELDGTTLPADAGSTLGFRILDDRGAAVQAFDERHERDLHFVMVSRNLVDYRHLHPELGPAGVWSVDVPALPSGSYRAYADFRPTGGPDLVLGADVTVGTTASGAEPPAPLSTTVVDGYDITLENAPGSHGARAVAFTVQRDGVDVRTEPYLGAAGHLVAIRVGDLAYLHVHPLAQGDDASVRFMVEFPSAGTYRLFFDFVHRGSVHTAAFTVDVADAASPAPSGSPVPDHQGH